MEHINFGEILFELSKNNDIKKGNYFKKLKKIWPDKLVYLLFAYIKENLDNLLNIRIYPQDISKNLDEIFKLNTVNGQEYFVATQLIKNVVESYELFNKAEELIKNKNHNEFQLILSELNSYKEIKDLNVYKNLNKRFPNNTNMIYLVLEIIKVNLNVFVNGQFPSNRLRELIISSIEKHMQTNNDNYYENQTRMIDGALQSMADDEHFTRQVIKMATPFIEHIVDSYKIYHELKFSLN